MTKKLLKRLTVLAVTFLMGFGMVFASESDYGAIGTSGKESYTLEEMLVYAIEDEYLARTEYDKIMETFGQQRPFSNIIKAEEHHIELLKPIFEKYNIGIPKDTSIEHVQIPETLRETYEIGVQAEINNIEMYERFLEQDVAEDVKDVFELLKNASQNHLQAFQRKLDRLDGQTGAFQKTSFQRLIGNQRFQCVIGR